ncbi:hypothetical protein VTN02DRAFT_2308 [Thermoascus thermophilus]
MHSHRAFRQAEKVATSTEGRRNPLFRYTDKRGSLTCITKFTWLIKRILTRVRKRKSIKTILDDFTGCVRPGELHLALERPGSGCSTFLRIIGSQRAGYKSVDGDVCYGGTGAKAMALKYRSGVLYNPVG